MNFEQFEHEYDIKQAKDNRLLTSLGPAKKFRHEDGYSLPEIQIAYEFWLEKQEGIKRANRFLQEKLNSPVLEIVDGKFVHSRLKGMFEIDGKWVYVTSNSGLAYEESIGWEAAGRLMRIVF